MTYAVLPGVKKSTCDVTCCSSVESYGSALPVLDVSGLRVYTVQRGSHFEASIDSQVIP